MSVDNRVMDLVSAAVGLRQAETVSRVQYAVARKMLEQQQLQGQAVVDLVRAAGQQVAKAGDSLVAQALGVGGKLDVLA